MKKLLLVILILPIFVYSQENKEEISNTNNESSSEVVNFILLNKGLLKKEWTVIGKENGVLLRKIYVENVITKESASGIEVNSFSQLSGPTILGILDKDELDLIITSLNYIKQTITKKPDGKASIEYISKDLLKLTATFDTFDSLPKWRIEIQPSYYYFRNNNSKTINVNKLDNIIELFISSKTQL